MGTLFQSLEVAQLMFRGSELLASDSFLACADKQLTEIFIKETGIKPDKNVCLVPTSHGINLPIYGTYIIPNTNKKARMLYTALVVNHNWNFITVYWKSKTNKLYKLNSDVDCDDIIFWFGSLDPLLYHKQLYPKEKLPFKIKDLSYELVVTRLNMDMTIEMQLKKGELSKADSIIEEIDKLIDDYNIQSEKKDRKNGVVHNWKRKVEISKLVYDIDTGSAGSWFLKKFLQQLSTMNKFDKVEVM